MNSIGLFSILGSYLLGAIPFGLLFSRKSGIDIRREGSQNIGATNVTRLLGKKIGALTLCCDLLKGFLPMLIAARLLQGTSAQNTVVALCGAAAILGHMFPVYLKFKGGKGVATALGVFLYLAPAAVLGGLVVFAASVYLSGFASLGSLLGSASMLLWLLLLGAPAWKLWLAAFVVAMIWIKHHQNIVRLLRGSEKSWKKKAEAEK